MRILFLDLDTLRAEFCREASFMLSRWQDGMMATSPSQTDPLWTVMREGGPFHARGTWRIIADTSKKRDEAGRFPNSKSATRGNFRTKLKNQA